ncbi:MAG: LysR family transcriptional regulator [Steroidobacteraceae bacterium]
MNLKTIDLNLLIAFEALIAEGHVTRAASALGLTQPATSNALKRLRLLFQDPLFIRVGRTMQPTTRARELSQPISAALAQVRRALSTPQFSPQNSSLAIRVATTDDIEVTLIPRIVKDLRAQAPAMKLVSRRLAGIFDLPLEDLQTGKLDLAIGRFSQQSPPASGIHCRHLYEDVPVCIVRVGHPGVRRRLTLSQFVGLEHVIVLYPPEGPGMIDRLLTTHGVQRNVAIAAPHFTTAAFAVANSDWVATVPARFAHAVADPLRLKVVPLPFKVPRQRVGLFWHGRNAVEPSHVWVREIICISTQRAYDGQHGCKPPRSAN